MRDEPPEVELSLANLQEELAIHLCSNLCLLPIELRAQPIKLGPLTTPYELGIRCIPDEEYAWAAIVKSEKLSLARCDLTLFKRRLKQVDERSSSNVGLKSLSQEEVEQEEERGDSDILRFWTERMQMMPVMPLSAALPARNGDVDATLLKYANLLDSDMSPFRLSDETRRALSASSLPEMSRTRLLCVCAQKVPFLRCSRAHVASNHSGIQLSTSRAQVMHVKKLFAFQDSPKQSLLDPVELTRALDEDGEVKERCLSPPLIQPVLPRSSPRVSSSTPLSLGPTQGASVIIRDILNAGMSSAPLDVASPSIFLPDLERWPELEMLDEQRHGSAAETTSNESARAVDGSRLAPLQARMHDPREPASDSTLDLDDIIQPVLEKPMLPVSSSIASKDSAEKSSLTGQMERKTGIKMVRFDICEPVSSDSAVHLPSALDMLKEEELENPPGTLYTVPRPHLVLPFDQEFRRMDRLRPALFAPSESRSGKNDGPSESRSGGNDAHRDGLQIEPLRGLHGLTIELSTRNLTRGVPASRTDMLKELGEETMDLSREDEEYFARALERCGKKKRIRSSRMMELQLEEESDEIMDASSSEEEQFATQAHDEHDEARRTASADEVQAAFDALAQHVSQAEGFDVDAMGMECVRDDQDFDFAFDTPHPDTHPDLDVHHGGHGLYVDQQQACANSMDTQSGGAEESCGTCAAEEQDEEVLGLSRGGAMALAEDFWRPLQDPEKYWADISLTRRAESV